MPINESPVLPPMRDGQATPPLAVDPIKGLLKPAETPASGATRLPRT